MSERQGTRWWLLFAVGGVVLALDQITKAWIVENLLLGETREPVPALSAIFRIVHSTNTGSAFGFLPQAGDVFLVLAILIVAGMLLYYPRIDNRAWPTQVGLSMVCGGAIGNALDRINHGHVIDFINYRIPDLISNVSNLADHAIVLGVIVIFLDSLRMERIAAREAAAIANAGGTLPGEETTDPAEDPRT